MWFPKAGRIVRLLITLIEETAQAPGKGKEETHGNTSERKKYIVARERRGRRRNGGATLVASIRLNASGLHTAG
jgi:hypothetical protein